MVIRFRSMKIYYYMQQHWILYKLCTLFWRRTGNYYSNKLPIVARMLFVGSAHQPKSVVVRSLPKSINKYVLWWWAITTSSSSIDDNCQEETRWRAGGRWQCRRWRRDLTWSKFEESIIKYVWTIDGWRRNSNGHVYYALRKSTLLM